MKKLILTCALLTSVVMAAMAQQTQQPNLSTTQGTPPTAEIMAEKRADMWQGKLNLSPEQKKQVYATELQTISVITAAKSSGMPAGRDKMMQASADREQKFKTIFTPQQWAQYEDMKPKPAQPTPAAK
jgi:hypothetical protein